MKTYGDDMNIQEARQFHNDNGLSYEYNLFEPYSELFYEWYEYASVNSEEDIFVETDLGKYSLYEGIRVPLDLPVLLEGVELGKPKRGGKKKYYVFVKNEKGDIIKVEFGDTSGLKVKINDPERRKAFAARHNCKDKNDKTKPSYWSCRLPKYAKLLGLDVDNPNAYW